MEKCGKTSLLMVRPTNFGTNFETISDNAFMKVLDMKPEDIQKLALKEFNEFAKCVEDAGVSLMVYDQCHEDALDSVFPNNWFSTHYNEDFPEGLLIIYPIKSPARRLEKNKVIIDYLKNTYKDFLDLSYLEEENEFLESTGCLIFDFQGKKVYLSRSERATDRAIDAFISEFNLRSKNPYKLITFKASDEKGNSIYHTNVVLSILEHHAVICADTIKDETERKTVLENLKENKKVLEVSYHEMVNYLCNILSVKNKDGKDVLILSKTAYEVLEANPSLKELLTTYQVCVPEINVLEQVGGGSARCMVAQIFEK
jgi:hypothetical protein